LTAENMNSSETYRKQVAIIGSMLHWPRLLDQGISNRCTHIIALPFRVNHCWLHVRRQTSCLDGINLNHLLNVTITSIAYSSPYLYQILIDFKTSFTDARSKKNAIEWSLNIPPDLKGVATLPCEM